MEQLLNNELIEKMSNDIEWQDMIDAIPTGICVFYMNEKSYKAIAMNETFCVLSGMSKVQRMQQLSENIFADIHKEDIPLLVEAIRDLYNQDRTECVYRYYSNVYKKYLWIYYQGVSILDGQNGKYVYCSFTDISKQKFAEIELVHKQEELETLIQSVPGGIFKYSADEEGIFSYVSDNLLKMLGFSYNEFLEKFSNRFVNMIYEDDRPRIIEQIRQQIKKSNYIYCEFRIPMKDGNLKWVYDRGHIITDAEGKKWIYVVVVDMDMRKKMEEILAQSENRYRQAIEMAELAVWEYDVKNHKLLSLKDNVESDDLVRFADDYPEGILKKNYIAKESEADYQEIYKKIESGAPVVHGEFWSYLKGNPNERRYKKITYTVEFDKKGSPILAHGVGVDATKEKLAEENYQRAIQQMALVNPDALGVIQTNLSLGTCTSMGGVSKFMELVPDNYEQLYGALAHYIIDEKDKADYFRMFNRQALLQSYFEGRETISKDLKIRFISGKEGFVQNTVRLVQNPVTGYIEGMHYALDVTEVHKREQKQIEKLQEALNEAERATEAKTTFLSNISHDMRTPLNGVIGFTNLAMEATTLEEKDEYLKKINESGQFLLSLINDTLELSKIESRKITLKKEPVNAIELIESVITGVKASADKKHIKLIVDTDKSHLSYIYVDRLRMQQIFLNLIGNAIKYTPEGGTVSFIFECLNEEYRGNNCKITVKDNGIGMTEEFVQKAFEPFSQDTNQLMLKSLGTGLGLSIVKQLVELMGGFIELTSKEGIGTSFDVFLFIERLPDYKKPEKSKEIDINTLKEKRILLCEDHPINTELARHLLEKMGIEVDCASNGKIGVDLFYNTKPFYYDAIIMDIRMPVMDGLSATKLIRESGREDSKKIPIIAMTANAFEEDRQKTKEAGMNAHLAKPIEPDKLYKTLVEHINSNMS